MGCGRFSFVAALFLTVAALALDGCATMPKPDREARAARVSRPLPPPAPAVVPAPAPVAAAGTASTAAPAASGAGAAAPTAAPAARAVEMETVSSTAASGAETAAPKPPESYERVAHAMADGAAPPACGDLPSMSLTPPKPSTQPKTINSASFRRTGSTLQSVADQLIQALEGAGYVDKGFYCVPGGFALATRVERIRSDTKVPWPGDARWRTGNAPLLTLHDLLSLRRVMAALTAADAGDYRMILFYVTNRTVQTSGAAPPPDFEGLPSGGPDVLPSTFSSVPFGTDYSVKAFVYEFERRSVGAEVEFVPQTLPTQVHLERAGILQRIR